MKHNLPKSFKLLAPYEKAEVWSNIELKVETLRAGARLQDLKMVNDCLSDLGKFSKQLQKHGVCEALEKVNE